jgi:putative DNA-invertase from lambdoid prophage Rac
VKTDQRNRSRYLGGKVPFGWTVYAGGSLIKHEKQQQAIARMKELRSAGHSLRSIAATLTADNFDLSHAGVKKILLSSVRA